MCQVLRKLTGEPWLPCHRTETQYVHLYIMQGSSMIRRNILRKTTEVDIRTQVIGCQILSSLVWDEPDLLLVTIENREIK